MEIKNRKGFVYTLEAIVASVLLLTTATVIVPQFGDSQNLNNDVQDRVKSGLEVLDKRGHLRNNLHVEGIEREIEDIMPSGYNYNVLLTEVDRRKINIDINNNLLGTFRSRFDTRTQHEWNHGRFNRTSADREDNPSNLGALYDGRKDPGLVGYWPLDDTSGSVRDYSGYGNNGMNNGSTRGVSGVFGTNAFSFTHEDDSQVNITDSVPEELDFSDETSFAVSAWVKWDGSESGEGRWIYSVGHSVSPGDRQVYLGITENNYLTFGYDADGGSNGGYWEGAFTHQEILDKDKWNHVVGTFDGSTVELYVDGEQASSSSVTVSDPDNVGGPAYIGQFPTENDTWQGGIDEVMVFNRSLSDKEIKELYHRDTFTHLGLGYRNGTEYDSLEGYWRFERASDTITDYSGNNNDAVNNGAKKNAEGVFSTDGLNFSSGDSLTISNTEEITETFSTNNLTIAFWIKHTEDTSEWDTLLRWDVVNGTGAENFMRTEMAGASNRSIYTRFIAENSDCGLVSDGGFWARSADMNHEPGKWNLYTVTYDGETVTEYANGQIQETNYLNCDLADISSDINIVGLPNSQLIDELQFYDRALSTEEVRELYLNGHQGSFTGDYSQNFTLPAEEVPKEIQVNSRNIDSTENVSWAKVSTDKGESDKFKLDSGNTDRNYSLEFSQEAEEISVDFNFSSGTPTKSPIIDNFKIWVNDSAEGSYHIDKEGPKNIQLYLSESDNLNVSFNQRRLITNHSDEGYEFSNLPDNEGYLKFFGTAKGTAEVNSKSINGESPDVEDVKNVNYILNEDGAKEVTVSLWQ